MLLFSEHHSPEKANDATLLILGAIFLVLGILLISLAAWKIYQHKTQTHQAVPTVEFSAETTT